MADTETDRRIARTRKIINAAFIEVMKEKPYDKITVQEIIDRADVGRSTFYSHYSTKDELLKNSIDTMTEMLDRHLSIEDGDGNKLIPVADFFRHIKENSRLIKSFIRGNSSELFVEKFQNSLNRKIETHILEQSALVKDPAVPLPILVSHISSTLIFLLRWWLDNKMTYSPAQMEQYFGALVIPSVESILVEK